MTSTRGLKWRVRGPRDDDVSVTVQPVSPAAMIALRPGADTIAAEAWARTGSVRFDMELVRLGE